jgi:hypothetical protein
MARGARRRKQRWQISNNAAEVNTAFRAQALAKVRAIALDVSMTLPHAVRWYAR